MWKDNSAAGVCAVCKYDPACIYEATSEGVILQCEQFEMGFRPEAPCRSEDQTSTAVHRADAANGYLGLCSNCENREFCIYPKPEGGVWRCEEYA